jgi:hypothetical protein
LLRLELAPAIAGTQTSNAACTGAYSKDTLMPHASFILSRSMGWSFAGLTELAMDALTEWPMAIAVSRPEDLPKIGIRSRARLRQWHLDLIMLGSLTAAASRFVPNTPRTVAVPLAVGVWVTQMRSAMVLLSGPRSSAHGTW